MKDNPEKSISLPELARENFSLPSAGPITGSGCSEPLGKPTPVFVGQADDVEVEKETGKVRVLSWAVAHDTGSRAVGHEKTKKKSNSL